MNEEKVVREDEEELPEKIRLTYTKTSDYRLIYVNGIYGGLTGKGELRFDFFQEFSAYPEEQIHEVTEDGRMGELVSGDLNREQLELIRERQVGVIMTMGFAKSLHDWLEQKIETFEQMIANQEESDSYEE